MVSPQGPELGIPGKRVDHPVLLGMEEVLHAEGPLVVREGGRRLESQVEVSVAGLFVRERFELDKHRGHEIEGRPDGRKFPQEGDHAPVVLEGMEPNPGEYMLAGHQVLVERLMHVPEEGDARHNGLTGCG